MHQEQLDSMSGLIQLTVQQIGEVITHELKKAIVKEMTQGFASNNEKKNGNASDV